MQIKSSAQIHYKRFYLSKGVSWIIIFVFVILALLMPVLPDYNTYQEIYKSGGGHLALTGRDLGFVLALQILEPILSYNQFRYFMLALVATLTLLALRNLQINLPFRLGMSLVIVLLPLLTLKFGIQIREGIALSLWIFVLLGKSQNPNPILFILLAFLSISIHAVMVPLWLILAVAYYLRPHWPRIATVFNILVYAAFIYLVADVTRLELDAFSGLRQEAVIPNPFMVFYWLTYPSIFIFSLLLRGPSIKYHSSIPFQLRVFDFVVHTIMIGFLVGLVFQIGLSGSTLLLNGIIADVLRLAAFILSLNCVLLVMHGKSKRAILFASFLIADTARIMLAA